MNAWLGTASSEYVRAGIAWIGHGKRSGLATVPEGDILMYCSPTDRLGDLEKLQHFTTLGAISDTEVRQSDEGEFKPFRRRIRYESQRAVLQEVSSLLHLTAAPHWSYQLRRGLVPLTPHDLELFCQRMVLEMMGTNRDR